jgi:hypothetical protein
MGHARKKVSHLSLSVLLAALLISKVLTSLWSITTGFRKLVEDEASAERTKKGSIVNKASEADDDDDAVENNDDDDPLAWVPKKIVTEWTNDDGIKCISVIIQLSGGETLADSNDAEVQVSSTGDELAVSEVWNPLMSDVRNFYLTFPKHKHESDENAMRKSIAMCDTSDVMAGGKPKRSTYRMTLPFRVDPSVKRIRFLGTPDGQRYASVDLAERSMNEVESFTLFAAKVTVPNSEKKRKLTSLY